MDKLIKTRSIRPTAAIILYDRQEVDHDRAGGSYCELHPIHQGKLGAGQPLTQESFDSLLEATTQVQLANRKKQRSVIFKAEPNRNIISLSFNGKLFSSLVWTLKAGRRPIFFTPDLNIQNGEAAHPTLIFKLSERTVSVFASIDATPILESELFLPPYFNLGDTGYLCTGSAKMKFTSNVNDQMKYIEEAFFNSYFSHAGGGASKFSYNLPDFWNSIVNQDKPFPAEKLLSLNKTVAEIL